MSLSLVSLVLLAALLHATWNAIVKTGDDRLIALMSVNLTAGIVAALFLPLVGVPAVESWSFIALSIALHTGYYISLVQAYTHGDLSHVYPLARGIAPVIILIGGVLFAAEVPYLNQLIGVLIVSAGIISLAFEHGLPWKTTDKRPLFYALLTGMWIASYTITDGIGVRYSGKPFAYIAWLFFLDIWLFSGYVIYKRGSKILPYLKKNWLTCLGAGIAAAGAYGIVIYALNQEFMAGVSALRETSVVIATLIGIFIFKEDNALKRISAAIVVAVGVIVINF